MKEVIGYFKENDDQIKIVQSMFQSRGGFFGKYLHCFLPPLRNWLGIPLLFQMIEKEEIVNEIILHEMITLLAMVIKGNGFCLLFYLPSIIIIILSLSLY